MELIRTDLARAIASHEVVLEEECHLGYTGASVGVTGGCDLKGCDEVLLAVGAELAHRELRAREDDRLG